MQLITSRQTAVLITMGFRLYQQGRLNNAKKIFDGLDVLAPKNAYVLGILGSIDQKQNKFDKAINHYTTALEMTPENLNLLTNRAECFLKVGKMQKAAADLKKAIELDKDGAHPAANRCKLLVQALHNALQTLKQKGLDAFLQER